MVFDFLCYEAPVSPGVKYKHGVVYGAAELFIGVIKPLCTGGRMLAMLTYLVNCFRCGFSTTVSLYYNSRDNVSEYFNPQEETAITALPVHAIWYACL